MKDNIPYIVTLKGRSTTQTKTGSFKAELYWSESESDVAQNGYIVLVCIIPI